MKNKSETASSSSSRIKPKILANGQLRCPNGTRRKGKYCVSKEAKNVAEQKEQIVVNLPKPQMAPIPGLQNDNMFSGADATQEPTKRLTIRVPKPKDHIGHVVVPEGNRTVIRVPVKNYIPKPAENQMQAVKPINLANGKLRCPDGTRRTKDGHWCVPKEFINVPFIREIIDEVAKKTQMEMKPKTPPHAIIMDKQRTPVPLDTREPDMVEDLKGLETPLATPTYESEMPKEPKSDVGQEMPKEPKSDVGQEPDLVETLLHRPTQISSQQLSPIVQPVSISSEPNELFAIHGDAKEYKRLNILKREKERAESLIELPGSYLFPTLNDPRFAQRIASHKAFTDTPYDGTTHEIEKRANEMCYTEFGLMPHQSFIRNFMSSETPYNTLLLFHSLGSGKTCSAISVCEEMRDYMKHSGLREKILVIASPNVQGNFRKQLFDESRLEKIVLNTDPEEYTWNIQSCVGNTLLREINPAQIRNYPREKIVSNIQSLISTYYSFMGYGQFANYVVELSSQYEIANIRRHFNNRLIVIDEVQNIRMTEENTNKEATAAAAVLLKVVKHASNLRLLLLTATPMYNSYKEIVWLTNLMNANDGRSTIDVKDVFDADGNIKTEKPDPAGESGMELLRRKLTGYVSYVRGENPYAFPFRIYPEMFAPERSLSSITYPKMQMNGKEITEPMVKMPVYLNHLSRKSQQYMVYSSIINDLAIGKDVYTATGKLKKQIAFDDMDAFGYTVLQHPIEALNISYPDPTGMSLGITGSAGLQSVITFDKANKTDFEYVDAIERVFSPEYISEYSVKMAEIGRSIRESEGIVIVYSQYIEGGIVPLALCMEEMGITRYESTPTTRPLFKQPPNVPPLMTSSGKQAKYIMITGDRQYSPANNSDMKIVSSGENANGDLIKVVLISRAGAEGLDFANVRQLHIMEPWYNMSRMEQIIGRAVRNLSHCRLPFNKRNVQIFLHGTVVDGTDEETADMYVYRLVEKKMHLIQNVERVMKETSVDCLIHIGQNNYTKSSLSKEPKNVNIPIVLSNGKTIEFTPGDDDDSVYECKSISGETLNMPEPSEEGNTTYSDVMARTNIQYISDRLRQLFRESASWSRNQLVKAMNVKKQVPIEQIFYTLSQFVGNQHNYVIDKYGRFGYIVNRDKYYLFQPMELTDTKLSVFERSVPIEYKRRHVSLAVSPEFGKGQVAQTTAAPDQRKTSAALQKLDDLFIAATDKNDMKKSKDWYIHAGHVFEHIEHVHFIPVEAQYNYFAHHFLDLMELEEKEALVKSLFPSTSDIDKNDLSVRVGRSYRTSEPNMRERVITYFAKRMLFNAKRSDILCLMVNKTSLVVLKRGVASGSEWKHGTIADLDYFVPEMDAQIRVKKQQLFPVIGFSGDFKGKEIVFKVKDLTQTRNNVGAKCESAGKMDIIKYVNQFLGHEQYTQENTDTSKSGGITQLGMCVILEMLMRDMTDQKKANRVYYLTPEQAVEIDITHI